MNTQQQKNFLTDFFTRLKRERRPGAWALLLIVQQYETSNATIQWLYQRVKTVSWETITKHEFHDELEDLKNQLQLS